jgi:hypothetical protein
MPHILAGPLAVNAGRRVKVSARLAREAERGSYMVEFCRDIEGGDEVLPAIWSPVVIPSLAMLRDLERSGFAMGNPMAGAVHLGEPRLERFFPAPAKGFYRIVQEQTRANPEPTVRAKLRCEHEFVETYRRFLARLARLCRRSHAPLVGQG